MAPSLRKSYGGPTESLIGYVVASAAAGIDLSIAAPQCDAEEVDAFTARTGVTNPHLFPSFGRGAFEISPGLYRWLRGAGKNFDVVHVHGLFNTISSLTIRWCIRERVPVVIRPFGTLSRYTFLHRRTTLKRAWLSLLERNNVRNASAIHFTTESERENAEWHEVPLDGRSYVIPPPFLRGDTAVRSEGWDYPDPAVLFLGRIEPVKNIEALLEAWPGVHSAYRRAQLIIAGAGRADYVRSLVKRAERLGVASSVFFPGFADAALKRDLLESASLFVLPSHHENFGIAVIEALDAGLPVVVSGNVQLAPFVVANRLGIVSETESVPLATAIIIGLGDHHLRERVRRDAPGALSASFSPGAVGQLLLQMYHAASRTYASRAHP